LLEADRIGRKIEPMRDPDIQQSAPSAESRSAAEVGAPHPVDEVDQARALEYALLATLLASSPDAPMIERLARLRGDETRLGAAHGALARAAGRASVESVEREYSDLFLGLNPSGLFPYASYYLAGALQGRPLARLREALQRLGVERTPGRSEPEDHAATLMEIMAGLAGGRIASPAGTEREMFDEHVAPWITRFFADLEKAGTADFYASVGALGRVFVEIEAEAFELSARGVEGARPPAGDNPAIRRQSRR
jgi:TorA maturation chaperone TorD